MQPYSADRLKFIRKMAGGISQQKLADALQVPVSKIKDVESGKNNITIELGLKLEAFSNCDFKWILTGEGKSYRSVAPQDAPPKQEDQEGTGGEGSNVIELDHGDVIKRFQDKGYAKDLNMALVELERLSPAAYQKVGTYIKGVVDGVRMMAGKDKPPCADRRKGERRIEDDPDQVPQDRDRRSGKDRRKAGANG